MAKANVPEEKPVAKVKSSDFLCMKKCVFMGRMHYISSGKDKGVYTFKDNVEVPEHFKRLGPHKEVLSDSAQIAVLAKQIADLEDQVIKLTAEKEAAKKDDPEKGGKD